MRIPDPPLSSKVFNKAGDLVDANIGHHHHMRYAALARELPLAHERLVARPLQHHRDAQRVQARRADAGVPEAARQEARVPQAPVDVVADAPATLGVERAPQEQRRVAVAAARDGGVSRRDVVDVGGQHGGVLSPRDHHAAGDRAAQELVA